MAKRKMDEGAAKIMALGQKIAPGSVSVAGSMNRRLARISTGNFGLDAALFGGVPASRITRFIGQPKSCKTGSCLNTAANYQKNHCGKCFQVECDCKKRPTPQVVWVDAEHRLADMLYWPEAHGVDLDHFTILEPPTGQQIVDFVDALIRDADDSYAGLIVVDSLANVTSQEELNKATMDGATIGRNASLLNSGWRKWVGAAHALRARLVKAGNPNPVLPTILCINQYRSKVGVVMGSPDVLTGGKGQDYATSIDVAFTGGPDTYVVWDAKKETFVARQKGFKSTFKPPKDAVPDFQQINFRVPSSGICPRGRSGNFNYWLRASHGHRAGDPDNGLQLWQFAKRYLLKQEGNKKYIDGTEKLIEPAPTYDALETAFRASPEAQQIVWPVLMKLLCSDDPLVAVAGADDAADSEDE